MIKFLKREDWFKNKYGQVMKARYYDADKEDDEERFMNNMSGVTAAIDDMIWRLGGEV